MKKSTLQNKSKNINWTEVIKQRIEGKIEKEFICFTWFNQHCKIVISSKDEKRKKFTTTLAIYNEREDEFRFIKFFINDSWEEAKDSANLLGKELDSETPILTLLKKNSEGITFSDIVGKKKIEKSMLSDPDVHIKKYDIISIKMDGFSSFNLNHAVVYLGEKKIVHISGSGNYFTGSDRWKAQIDTWEKFMEDHKETNHMIVYYPIVPFKRPELIQKHIEMAISVKYGLGKYHLLKNNCEHFATLCVVGVPFSKQADITFNSTNGKIDKEYVLKKMEESNELFSKRNILLIGSTGAGKSTLANVISGKSGENALKEAESSTSETREIQTVSFETEEGKYWIIDTIGFSDTQLTLAQIISRIARGCEKIKDGINQVLFVIGKRFTPEEVKTYNMLKDFFFDKEVTKYTTIVRTNFTNFEDKDICANDIEGLIKESNEGVVEMINSCDKRIIHVDNPSININFNDSNKERVETQIGLNKAVREESRKILLKHLKTCEKVYKPENFDKVDKLIKDDVMKENKRLRKELKKIKSERKKEDLIQERVIELNKKIDDLKEEIKNNEKLIERKMIELIGDNLKAVIEVCCKIS